jgi:hypothetical protein
VFEIRWQILRNFTLWHVNGTHTLRADSHGDITVLDFAFVFDRRRNLKKIRKCSQGAALLAR